MTTHQAALEQKIARLLALQTSLSGGTIKYLAKELAALQPAQQAQQAQDHTQLLRMLANRARHFPGFPLGYHMPEVFAALGEQPPDPGQQAQAVPAGWEGAEEWMPLAWALCANECGEEACTELVWEGGPIPEPWGDRWLKYEDQAKEMISMVRKHVASPPQAQPEQQAAAVPTESQILAACEEAGLWPNTAASWVANGAFNRYHEAINRMLAASPSAQEPQP